MTRQYPLLLPGSSASRLAPETQLQGGRNERRKRKEKSEREDAEGEKKKKMNAREIYFNETVF